jgi:hypothetical protein
MWGDELMPVEVEVALDDDGNVTVAYENCCCYTANDGKDLFISRPIASAIASLLREASASPSAVPSASLDLEEAAR